MVEFGGYLRAGTGFLFTIIGAITALISYYIIPPIINFLVPGDYKGASTVILFILWTLVLVVLPNWKTYDGISQINEDKTNILIGILWIIATIMLLYVGSFVITAIGNLFTEQILKAMFYTGIILNIVMQIAGVGIYSIIKGTRT